MMVYLLVLLPFTLAYLFGLRFVVRSVRWSYRGLLLVSINGVYLVAVFAIAQQLWEAS